MTSDRRPGEKWRSRRLRRGRCRRARSPTSCSPTAARTWRAKAPTTPGTTGRRRARGRPARGRAGRARARRRCCRRSAGSGSAPRRSRTCSPPGPAGGSGCSTRRGSRRWCRRRAARRVADADGWLTPPPADRVPRRDRRDRRADRPRRQRRRPARSRRRRRPRSRGMLDEQRVEAIAVSFLWSFVNPAHEAAGGASRSREAFPDMSRVSRRRVCIPRSASTSARRSHGAERLRVGRARRHRGARGRAWPRSGCGAAAARHSAGGSITVDEARRQPLGLAVSGPAAGVAAAVEVGAGHRRRPPRSPATWAARRSTSRSSSGQPARRTRGELMGVWTALSLIDVESIGAGGGSLGWVDARGMLRVGPRSAGAVPGPAATGAAAPRPRSRTRSSCSATSTRPLPRRRHGARRRRRATTPARASASRWGSTPTRPRGASGSSRSPAW